MSKIPERKRQKVAMFSIGTDEVVVAKISKRVAVKIATSEGLHIIS
jgi:hypothetical protein